VKTFRVAGECSERHVYGQLEVMWLMVRYRRRESRYADANERLRARLRELAEERRQWGYRRLHVLLEREGWVVKSMRVYRIYVEEKLVVRRRKRRRRICAQARLLLAVPAKKNVVDRIGLHTGGVGHRSGHLTAGTASGQSGGQASARTRSSHTSRHRQRHVVHL
jgi:HTH-like domain